MFFKLQNVPSKYIPEKQFGGHCARLREKENLFPYRAYFEGNLLHFVRACAHVHALMTRKLCNRDVHCNTKGISLRLFQVLYISLKVV